MTRLADLATLCRSLEASAGRLDKLRLVAEFLRAVDEGEVVDAVAFLTGRAFPASDPRVLGVRGLPVPNAPAATPSLGLADVADAFAATAEASGPGSRRLREDRLTSLMTRATDAEASLLRRIVGGEMR